MATSAAGEGSSCLRNRVCLRCNCRNTARRAQPRARQLFLSEASPDSDCPRNVLKGASCSWRCLPVSICSAIAFANCSSIWATTLPRPAGTTRDRSTCPGWIRAPSDGAMAPTLVCNSPNRACAPSAYPSARRPGQYLDHASPCPPPLARKDTITPSGHARWPLRPQTHCANSCAIATDVIAAELRLPHSNTRQQRWPLQLCVSRPPPRPPIGRHVCQGLARQPQRMVHGEEGCVWLPPCALAPTGAIAAEPCTADKPGAPPRCLDGMAAAQRCHAKTPAKFVVDRQEHARNG